MVAEELIDYAVPAVEITDSVKKALNYTDDLKLSHIPVVKDNIYQGLISETILLEADENSTLEMFQFEHIKTFARKDEFFFDLIRTFAEYQIPLLPVLDEKGQYIGVVTINNTIMYFSQSSFIQTSGGVLVLSVEKIHYSLAEISRIVESDDAKILGVFIFNHKDDPSKINVTLKLDRMELGRLVSSLRRFGYNVTHEYYNSELINVEKERLDHLFRYINI